MNPLFRNSLFVTAWVLSWQLAAASPTRAPSRVIGGDPAWAAGLPAQGPYGGSSGRACLATPVAGNSLLLPAHCVAGAAGRDYAFEVGGFEGSGRSLARSDLPASDLPAGSQVWVRGRAGWARARVLLASGAQYWIEAAEPVFCPGDSGSQVWAGEAGSPRLAGMLVGGGEQEGEGCSRRASAIKSRSIGWPWAL